ncbi:MAG: heme-degrading domain-containing protein [Spirochaetes bacterium]|nr:heme-degrading domain-containing protein [Spirochaetota bacterium]
MDNILKTLLQQEADLRFPAFDENTAWALGSLLVETAKARNFPIAIDIRRGERQLFHASMPGASADNDQWISRKVRTVNRFGHSSFYMGNLLKSEGKSIFEKYFVSETEYAAHGGCFPIIVKGTGIVGTVAVSGLPQEEDHRLVVECIAIVLNKTP